MLTRNAQQNLQANMSRLAKLQEQAQTSAAITRPSDNPAGTADALKVRAEMRANTAYKSNISDANSWLATLDNALTRTNDILTRIKDLSITAATATTTAASKAAIATEIEGLKKDLLGQANTSYLGRSIFAGNSDAGSAVVENSPVPPATAPTYTFNGVGHGPVNRRIDANTVVRVDASAARSLVTCSPNSIPWSQTCGTTATSAPTWPALMRASTPCSLRRPTSVSATPVS